MNVKKLIANTASDSGGTPTEQSTVANIRYVTGRVWTGGDLPSHLGEEAMLADLAGIQQAGITHILDNRIECSDEAFVEARPEDDLLVERSGRCRLATGMEPVAALTTIRRARPVAAISYAGDALDWWHRTHQTPASVAKRQRAAVARWHRRNPIDVVRIIRTIRSHEDNGRPLSA